MEFVCKKQRKVLPVQHGTAQVALLIPHNATQRSHPRGRYGRLPLFAQRDPHLGLLHCVEVEVEALEVDHQVVREGLDRAPLLGVERDRLTLALKIYVYMSCLQ